MCSEAGPLGKTGGYSAWRSASGWKPRCGLVGDREDHEKRLPTPFLSHEPAVFHPDGMREESIDDDPSADRVLVFLKESRQILDGVGGLPHRAGLW